VSIVGHNGAGKTTLSKLMMGILKPTTGNMIIEGKKIKRLTPLEIGKKMGISFQNPEHQFIKMTVEDELKLGLILTGYSKKIIEVKVEKYLRKFKLTEQRHMNPFLLSQGQKRRLSTASMLIGDQQILILDEPTYGQDRENLIELMDMLEKFQEKDRAILMITHDLELVEKCCHRVIQLENGKIIFDGTREKFLEKGY
jgi:energy-coupling factor transport system ATP-binding protein